MPDAAPPSRELILLSPYRLPAQNASYLGNDDMACFLNAYSALWHPAAARGAVKPPRVASPYDFEQPSPGHVYAVPESPPLVLPDDWDQRVRAAGAVAFRGTPERQTTLDNLREALRGAGTEVEITDTLFNADPDRVAVFFGVGFGYLMIEGLYEAMEHENLIATSDLWSDLQQAVAALLAPPSPEADAEAWRRHLQSAADRLRSARDVLYPVTIHLLDLFILDEARPAEPWPAAFERGLPLNVLASAAVLEKLGREQPERLAALREKAAAELVEVCGGSYLEREDALLPVQSQLWNLLKGQAAARDCLQQDVRVFGRKRFGAHPQLPLLLNAVGLNRALLLTFDESVLPNHRATVINWPSPDGKQVEAFTRAPNPADTPQTFFHVAHHLHRTIMQDHAATLALLHTGARDQPWYRDWLELSRLAPVLGTWTTFTRYFNDVLAGEYTSPAAADDFHGDYLNERVTAHDPQPVTWFAAQARWRRRLDSVWTLAGLYRGLAGRNDTVTAGAAERLARVEDAVESAGRDLVAEESELSRDLATLQKEVSETLAGRLLARATGNDPGYLVLNPCSYTRRLALELDGFSAAPAAGGPVKASQLDGSTARLVVDVPALGFAWFSRGGAQPGAAAPAVRMKLADQGTVRNEFLEAEIDPQTGGLRGIRDHRTRINRVAQQLVFNPGSTARATQVKVTSTGPCLGEIVTEGDLFDEQNRLLARFRQRFRAWLGRPVLEVRIEIMPEHLPQGYPWHAYYGARFAWRDERAMLLRGVNGSGSVTTHTRPVTPDYLELRLGSQRTTIFPGGLPFHQRHGGRMLDVILLPEGETGRVFDLALALDRDNPMQLAQGMVTPVSLVPAAKGPPHVGTAGWLFHLDAPNLLLLNLRPGPDGADGVVARLLECASHTGPVELRCVRDPQRAALLDGRGNSLFEVSPHGDCVPFEATQNDLLHLRVDFSG
jgi:hypothetical protein